VALVHPQFVDVQNIPEDLARQLGDKPTKLVANCQRELL